MGGAFGGAAATAWLTMLAGDFMKLLPWVSNLIRPETSGRWHPTVIGKSIFNFAFGLPSWGWMLPREGVLGVNHVSPAAGPCLPACWMALLVMVKHARSEAVALIGRL